MCSYCGFDSITVIGRFMDEHVAIVNALGDHAVAEGGDVPTDPVRQARGLRTAIIALAGASLLTGLNAGLLRLGVWAPVPSTRIGDLHGPVMVLGFMGTLISLERAQALRNNLAYLAPALLGIGSLVLVAGGPEGLGKLVPRLRRSVRTRRYR